ncbi:hypothetical protein HMPREF1316_1630 [Olsenella profusa F0195]|uniref:Uncharacterized protein n=2 Tax=Olsenella profusa TaxID=138595 RepID=U2VAA7_9ACTN|nr:hypothetical protein HMPREF1316_1630 [Olsenella profusa F0195]
MLGPQKMEVLAMGCDDKALTVTVELAPETARVASEQAARAGVGLDEYVRALVAEEVERRRPWRFEIEFDEQKAREHGYDVETLYEYVGKNVEPMGNVRVGRGTWQVRDGADEFRAQPVALSDLVRMGWVMENVASITSYDEDGTPEDYLQVIKEVSPQLLDPMQKPCARKPSGT